MMQLDLHPLCSEARTGLWVALDRYAARHRALYQRWAIRLVPSRTWEAVWDRLAFAILTADTATENAVSALRATRQGRGRAYQIPGIVPVRWDYVAELPRDNSILRLLRCDLEESWNEYRMRLRESVVGLGLTKASYASCLLHPSTSENACLDIWMQRILLRAPHAGFVSLTTCEYLGLERLVAHWSARQGMNAAMGQWMMWDFIRQGRPLWYFPLDDAP